MAKIRARRKRQQRREKQQIQGSTEHYSDMDFDQEEHYYDMYFYQEDDDRRRNTSSEDEGDESDEEDDDRSNNTCPEDEGDEGDEGDDDSQGQLATTRPPVVFNFASLVDHASQMIGKSVDGSAMALAAANAPTTAEALNLLAASSVLANLEAERASNYAAHAVDESDSVAEGLCNTDSTFEKRFNRYDEELQHLKDGNVELQNRVALLEGRLSRVLSILAMMQNGNIYAAEVRTPYNAGNLPHNFD